MWIRDWFRSQARKWLYIEDSSSDGDPAWLLTQTYYHGYQGQDGGDGFSFAFLKKKKSLFLVILKEAFFQLQSGG